MSRRTNGLVRSLLAVSDAVSQLEASLLALDPDSRSGVDGADLGRHEIRAKTLVIHDELTRFGTMARDRPTAARAQPLLVGRLRTLADVISFIERQMAAIETVLTHSDRGLRPYYGDEPAEDLHRRCLRNAIGEAQRAIVATGDNPDLNHFLDAGMQQKDWPEMQAACVNLTLAFWVTAANENPMTMMKRRRQRGAIAAVAMQLAAARYEATLNFEPER